MKKTLITSLKIIIPFGIGIYLTWFFVSNLSDKDFANLKDAFLTADYSYIIYGFAIMLLSHMSRAYRWKYMLEPLGHRPSFWKMYHSVMIGYLLNLTIPRSGEVARAGYYAKYEKEAKADKVFGTILIERIIDLIMLGLVLAITVYLQKDVESFNAIRDKGSTGSIPKWFYWIAGTFLILTTIIILILPKLREKIKSFILGILEGVKTIFKLKQRLAYIAHTIFIWFCYVFLIWVFSFALPETANLNVNAVFAAFVVGAAAISASPGGLGLYPWMVSLVLTDLYMIENASSFSMLAWSTLTLFTIVFGLISIIVLPFISDKSTQ